MRVTWVEGARGRSPPHEWGDGTNQGTNPRVDLRDAFHWSIDAGV